MRRLDSLTVVLWLWVLAVAGYFAWGFYSYSGLYRILAEWQIREWGSYRAGWTALIPGFLLAGPALSVLGRRARLREAAEAGHDPAAKTRRAIAVILPLGLVCLIGAAGAYYYSTTLPGRDAPATTVDIATLGNGVPPEGAVILVGEAQAVRTVMLQETMKGSVRLNRYIPLAPPGSGPAAAIRFFLKTNASHYMNPSAGRPQAFDGSGDPVFPITTQVGVLIENGLPGPIEALYAQDGIALTRPYYVLDLTPEGARAPFYIGAAVGGFSGLLLLFIALLQWRLVRRLRQA